MAKKINTKRKINSGIIGIIIGSLALLVSILVFLIQYSSLGDMYEKYFNALNYNSNSSTFNTLSVSEDSKWLQLPEYRLRFPLTAKVAYEDFGGRPSYRMQDFTSEEDSKTGYGYVINFSYAENNFAHAGLTQFLSATIVYNPEYDLKIGENYPNTYGSEKFSDGEEKIVQKVSGIVNLKDGKKIYILSLGHKDFYKNGVYKYENLTNALKNIEQY